MPTLIAFDLDGTLANTEAVTLPNLLKLLAELYNIHLTVPQWMERYHGMSGQPLLDKLNAAHGTTMVWAEFYPRRFERLEQAFLTEGVDPCPGVLQVIRTLVAQGQKIAIVSNSSPKRIDLTLNILNGQRSAGISLEKTFKGHTFGASDPARPERKNKPAPDVYLAALAHYQLKGKDCLAIEDSPTGVQSAVAAGIPCWGYTGVVHNPEEAAIKLKQAGAKKVFNHWDDFLAMLKKLEK